MKQSILLQVLSLMMLQLVAQPKTVKVHGVVKDTAVKSIELTHPVDVKLSRWEDTKVDVINGVFNTSIQVPFPVEISISYGNRVFRKNYIYSDAEILIDTAGELHLIGSPLHEEYKNEFLPFFRSNDQIYDSLRSFYARIYKKYGQDIPKIVKDSAILLQDKYYGQRATLLGEYIKRHPNSYVPLWDINFFVAMSPTHRYFDFEKLFSSFSDRMQQQPFISILKEKIKESAKMQVGQLFPKEFFKGYEQMQSRIQENNQYYLIDFWYSHCVPCVARFPKLKEIYHQFHSKGFDIVSISVDKQKDKKDYLAAIKKYGLAWNHIWDKEGVSAEKFSINVFPTYILLDKNGSIINPNVQDSELEAFLKKSLSSR
ncbi:MAG TPA: TlpA disulfide reductase family protein [Flavisolibacter sp.]|jgi:thiol-disulfide isomerase/thioredoxin|nr:TlpA disulfide reductase family protein [Flavisolibacter sp.]